MIILLKNVSTTGTSDSWFSEGVHSEHTIQVVDNSTTATAITISLEGSLDDTNFFTLGEYEFTAEDITNSGSMVHIVNKPASYVRINLSLYTGGSDLTATYVPSYVKAVQSDLVR